MNFATWRTQARALLRAGIAPHDVSWEPSLPFAPPAAQDNDAAIRVPQSLFALLDLCACYDDPRRWALMYRVLWRATLGGEARLLEDEADPDVRRIHAMAKSIAKGSASHARFRTLSRGPRRRRRAALRRVVRATARHPGEKARPSSSSA